ncbi:MAG: polymerase-associated protein RapA [Planctomycetota bacterium]|jgi:ATP-dependent helicase HepA
MPKRSPNPNIGKFVRSSVNDYGIGKIVDSNLDLAVVEYFDTPIAEERITELVPFDESLRPVRLQRQTRVYLYDKQAGFWRMGRVHAHIDDMVYVDLPNKQSVVIPETEAFVRWDRPLGDPWSHLEARLTETPFFHVARSSLIAELTEHRAASSGMTGLLSAPIELERHQVEVINRILKDPCQRYLLADEVGLGKTIEAGVVIRQHLIDNPVSHSVLIIVPEGLVDQWITELHDRCQISALQFGHKVEVITYSEALAWKGGSPDFLVVDEAHQIVGEGELFDWLRHTSAPERCSKLLLLSATPVLRNEKGFLSLLHLLDPLVNKLEDAEAFRQRVAKRQELANLFAEFAEDQDIFHIPVVTQDLKNRFPVDKRLTAMLDEVEAEVLRCQAQMVIENPQSLKRAIGKARAHLSESYRLHRRVLRNRRNKDLNEILTGRDRLELIPFPDQGAVDLEEALENWRSNAVASLWAEPDTKREKSLVTIFVCLLQATWCDPEALFQLVKIRKKLIPACIRDFGPLIDESQIRLMSELPYFIDEETSLDRILALEERLGFSRKERLARLGKVIKQVFETDKRIDRLVFFATSPAFADDLYDHLLAKYGDAIITRHAVNDNGWKSRWKRPGPQFLICDWTAEEGLNLQGGFTCMIHVDLPLSPNRMEQRIGRLDRFGTRRPSISFILDTPECQFSSAWRTCLNEGWKVFSRSVAALQYVIDEEMQKLLPQLFQEGVDALNGAGERLSTQEGIEEEFRLIRNQDALDAIETSYRKDTEELLEKLEAVSANWRRFHEVVDAWMLERLHFIRVGDPSENDLVFRYHYHISQKGRNTLLSQEQFMRWFNSGVDSRAKHRLFNQPLSHAMSFSRQTACARNVGLAGLGNPWIDCILAHSKQDDRGSSFALWRMANSKNLPEGEIGRVIFRLDYLIEANLGEDINVAIRRKADAAFAPIYKTLWIDQDLTIPDKESLEWIEEPYCPQEDTNIRAEHWAQAIKIIGIKDWAGLCSQVHSTAEGLLREQTNLKSIVDDAVKLFTENTQEAEEQAQSRLEMFGKENSGLELEFEEQARVARIVMDAISAPKVRLDSCGVVFLASVELNLKSEGEIAS